VQLPPATEAEAEDADLEDLVLDMIVLFLFKNIASPR